MEIFVPPLGEQWNPGAVPDDLRTAVEAVAVALDELHAEPGSPAATSAVGHAAAAVMVLQSDPTRDALQQLVMVIDDCHQSRSPHSTELERAWGAVAATLQFDVRWM
jgi:hypothetical protein